MKPSASTKRKGRSTTPPEGVGTIVWSPLARGRLAREWDDARATARSTNHDFADMLYTEATADSDREIIDASAESLMDAG